MPSNADNSELANRLAMQAAALEADNLDPLGLGRIDGQALSLVSTSCSQMLTASYLLPPLLVQRSLSVQHIAVQPNLLEEAKLRVP